MTPAMMTGTSTQLSTQIKNDILGQIPTGVSLQNVPDFEKSIASQLKLELGTDKDSIAHGFSGNDPVIYADKPKELTQEILDHEVWHKAQNILGMKSPSTAGGSAEERVSKSFEGDIGSLDSLRTLAKKQGNNALKSLSNEQQAQLLQNYEEGLEALKGSSDKDIADFKSTYQPYIDQMSALTRTITPDVVKAFYNQSGGDPKKAAALAAKAGYKP